MQKLSLIIFILSFTYSSLCTVETFSFKDVAFGMSMEKVKNLETGELWSETIKSITVSLIVPHAKTRNKRAEIQVDLAEKYKGNFDPDSNYSWLLRNSPLEPDLIILMGHVRAYKLLRYYEEPDDVIHIKFRSSSY